MFADAHVVPQEDDPVTALEHVRHDVTVDVSCFASPLPTFEVLRRPIEFASYAALTYCRFRTFTLRIHGNLQASHNATERGLRGLVIGRKNHYGSRSRRGTEVAAVLYSLVETAKLCGVEPKGYLRRAVTAALAGEQIPLPHELAASAQA